MNWQSAQMKVVASCDNCLLWSNEVLGPGQVWKSLKKVKMKNISNYRQTVISLNFSSSVTQVSLCVKSCALLNPGQEYVNLKPPCLASPLP